MLEIFRNFKEETSLFNDFEMYEKAVKKSGKKAQMASQGKVAPQAPQSLLNQNLQLNL